MTGAATPNCRRSNVALSDAWVDVQLARRDSSGCAEASTGAALVSTTAGAEVSVRSVSGRPGAEGAERAVLVVVVGCEAAGTMRRDWRSGC